jgi:hypothetical protein
VVYADTGSIVAPCIGLLRTASSSRIDRPIAREMAKILPRTAVTSAGLSG